MLFLVFFIPILRIIYLMPYQNFQEVFGYFEWYQCMLRRKVEAKFLRNLLLIKMGTCILMSQMIKFYISAIKYGSFGDIFFCLEFALIQISKVSQYRFYFFSLQCLQWSYYLISTIERIVNMFFFLSFR